MTILDYLHHYDENWTLTSDDWVIADWNAIPDEITHFIEEFYDIDWPDSSEQCSDCYCHIGQYEERYVWECDITCKDCTVKAGTEVVEDAMFYADSIPVYPKGLHTWMIPAITEAGFVPLHTIDSMCKDSYESGLYKGMNDSPGFIADEVAMELGGTTEMVFVIDDYNPFMVKFSAYVRLRDGNET